MEVHADRAVSLPDCQADEAQLCAVLVRLDAVLAIEDQRPPVRAVPDAEMTDGADAVASEARLAADVVAAAESRVMDGVAEAVVDERASLKVSMSAMIGKGEMGI